MFLCSVCSKTFFNVIILIRHLKFFHQFTSLNDYRCGQKGCMRTFQSLSVFKYHLLKKHKNEICQTNNQLNIHYQQLNYLEPNFNDHETNDTLVNNTNCKDYTDSISSEKLKELVSNASTAFCAKLYSIKNLPRSHIQTIIENIDEYLTAGYLPILKDKVISILNQLSCGKAIISEIKNCFEVLNAPFEGLTSEYLRLKSFQQNRFYVQPQSYVIGSFLINKINESGINKLENCEVFGQFIPVTDTLKEFFQLPGVYQSTQQNIININNCSDSFYSIMQGKVWKKKLSMFPVEKHKEILPLILYFDDFETGNALGSHAAIHKTGVVYYTVPAIPLKHQSKLENIFVSLIFNSNDRVQFGNEATFQPLIVELTKLETEGMAIETSDGKKHLYFVVLAIVGDNLGINSIMGFVESFSANHYCRICRCHKSEMSKQTIECPDMLRKTENYHADILRENVSETGISSKSVWTGIPSFDTNDNCVVDIMHDVFEGVCRYDMGLIIEYLISHKLFSLEVLNFRLKYFDFGKNISNVPPQINNDHLKKKCIIMSATEMANFVKYFPLIIGDLVPEDIEVWHFFLVLKEFVDAILSDEISSEFSNYVEGLVREHHQLYLQLFNETLKPKHHFLVHYPRVILMFGPLKQLWCMRFEGKHKELKQTAVSVSSRKNLPLTLGIKCQLIFTHRLIARAGFKESCTFGRSELISSETLNGYDQFRCSIPENVLSVNWAEINCIRYMKSNVLLIEIVDQNPVFGKIEHIFCNYSSSCTFVLSKYRTVGYNSHFRAYHVSLEIPKLYVICEYPQLLDSHIISINKNCNGNMYVTYY